MNEPAPAPSIFRSPLAWAALVSGTLLRAVGLANQILLDDEVHTFRAVLERGFPEVLWRYRPADHCIPLTSLLRAWMEAGVPPAEWMLRLPILAAGVAILVLVPRWLAPRLGRPAAVGAAWMLALAPTAVYYSRIMRPYMLVALTACGAGGLFLRWWQKGDRRALAGYTALAGLTIYLHPVFAPFVLAPFAFVLWETRGGWRWGERSWRELTLAGLGVALLVAAFLVPGWQSFHRLLTEKPGVGEVWPATWMGVAQLVAGSTAPWLACVAWGLIVWGAVHLARVQPLAARFGATLVLGQLLAILVAAPLGIGAPAIFLRYNIASLILLCALLGIGLATPPGRFPRSAWRVLAVGYVLAFAATHPLRDPRLLTRGFGLSVEFLTFPEGPDPWTLGRPAPYTWLDRQGAGSVVETPVRLFPNDLVRPLRAWSLHGRRVRVVPAHSQLLDPRLGLRSVAAFGSRELLASGARFVIVHTDVEPWIERRAFIGDMGGLKRRRVEQMRHLGRTQSRELRQAYGPPDSRGEGVEIWDLERVRARAVEP